ncbi:MAG: hypothetical protein ACI4RA_06050, partial [Kiritimatiellia bacterium]
IVPSEEEFFKASGSTYTLTKNEETGVWECRFDDSAYLAQVLAADGTTVLKKCLSLEAAIAQTPFDKGAYVQMLANAKVNVTAYGKDFEFTGASLAIDMNGWDLEVTSWFSDGASLCVPSGQTLTLMNSNEGKDSTIIGSRASYAKYYDVKVDGGTLNLKKGVKVSRYGLFVNNASSQVTVEGTVENTQPNALYSATAIAGKAAKSIVIRDGAVVSSANGAAIDISNVGEIAITGGAFKGAINVAGQTGFITGGVFSVVPDKTYLAAGYEVVDNTAANKEDYPYMVAVAVDDNAIVVNGRNRPVPAEAAARFAEVADKSPVYEVVKRGTDETVGTGRNTDFATLVTGIYTMRAKVTEDGAEKAVAILDVGVVQVAARKTTILAVPFNGIDAKPVTVATLFDAAAAGLKDGDTLNVYDATAKKYVNFAWKDGAWASADENNANPAAYTLAPGSAAVLNAKNTSKGVTLVGTPAEKVEAVPVGANEVGLGGNTATANKKVKDLAVAVTGADGIGVRVFVPAETDVGNTQYAWNGSKWVKRGTKTINVGGKEYTVQGDVDVTDDDEVPAGTGYWIRNATSGEVTVK